MKKFLSIVLSICLIMVVIPIGAFSLTASAETDGYYTYEVIDGGAYITEVDTSISGVVIIPDTLGGYPVVDMNDSAFDYCDKITGIVLPLWMTQLHFFIGCTSVTTVVISHTVTYIGPNAFRDSPITNVYYEGSQDDWYFNISVPDYSSPIFSANVICDFYYSEADFTYDPYDALDGIITITGCNIFMSGEVNIPSEIKGLPVKRIYYRAFADRTEITGITIPDSVTWIGSYAFSRCSSIKNVTIGNGVTSIGESAFSGCTSLTSVTIPDSVTSIDSYAFNYCTALSDVYYDGSENDRENITVGSSNNYLTGATWHYNYCKVGGVHTYGEWIIDIEPTCTSNGLQIKKCEHCGKTIERIINGSHSYGNWIVAGEPTCTSDGAEHRVCLICGVEEERIITALGHNYDVYFSSVAATCKNNGYYSAKCRNCGIVDIITTSGHIYKNGKCVSCDISSEVVESEHDYAKNTNQTWTVTKENASCLKVYFSAETQTESRYDFIYIYDGADNLIGEYSGTTLAGQTITVSGDAVKIRLTSDSSIVKYGFHATVTPESIAGDTNGDGAVNALDMLNIQDAILTGAKTAAYDVTGDGLVNLLDLVRIKKILANRA